MIDERVETIEQYLEREVFGDEKVKPVKAKREKNKPKKKKRGLVLAIVAGVLVLTTAISGIAIGISKLLGRNKNTKNSDRVKSTVSTVNLNDMGETLDFPNEDEMNQPIYGETTGEVDVNEIISTVDPKTGKVTIWKNAEAKEKSKNIGKKETDTKNGTLTITSNGTVKEKAEGYQVIDEKTGSVIASGNGNIPAGKVWDPEVNAYVDPSEVGKYVILTKDYKDPATGAVVFKKGYQVEKTTLARFEEYVKNYNSQQSSQTTQSSTTTSTSTPAPATVETPKEQTSSVSGKTNADGTYTVNGLTFKSKADYEQWIIQGYEGYDLVDGIMMSETDRIEYQKTLNR